MGDLSNSRGMPTGAVYGFATSLRKLIEDRAPDYLAVAFDRPEPTFRHKQMAEYKAHREPMPDDLAEQIPWVKDLVAAFRIPVFELAGYEADDILATLAQAGEDKGLDVYLVARDKDLMQLVTDRVKVLYMDRKEMTEFDSKAVEAKYGVPPKAIPELLALMGDSTDGYAGVPGIGPKKAQQLIREYGTVENLLNKVDLVRSVADKNRLKDHAEEARQSLNMAVLDAAVPLEIEFADMALEEPDYEKLEAIYREMEFRNLLVNLPRQGKTADFPECAQVQNAGDWEAFEKELSQSPCLGLAFFETEKALTLALAPAKKSPVLVSLGPDPGLDRKFRGFWEKTEAVIVGFDLKDLGLCLKRRGAAWAGQGFDIQLGAYLLDPSRSQYPLDELVLEHLDEKVSWDPKAKDPAEICASLGEKAAVLLRLEKPIRAKLEENNLKDLYEQVEAPLIEVLRRMEETGITVDADYLKRFAGELDAELEKTTRRIYKMAGEEFNLNSPKQLAHILFEVLGLPVIKRGKTGPSTDVEVLQTLSFQHDLPQLLLGYREVAKLKSTYVDALPRLISPVTGRVHSSLNQTVTATGRLSSSNPNLQNIPVRTELGRRIRGAFVAPKRDWVLLSADYSQIELRILAHLSGDKELSRSFKEGLDVHTYTASLIYESKMEDVDRQMRAVAKTVNFGIAYGMKAFGLAKDLGIEVADAEAFIQAYFKRYPGVKHYMDAEVEKARSKGYVTTLLNRRRYIPDIKAKNPSIRQFAERTAINTPVQGSAADLIKVAMLEVSRYLGEEAPEGALLLQVHDELVLEMPKKSADKIGLKVKEIMETVLKLDVPVEVSLKVGSNWLEMQALT